MRYGSTVEAELIQSDVHPYQHNRHDSWPAALLAEMGSAFEELRRYMAELAQLLDQPELDRGRLTTVRLRIAQLRLARGTLIGRVTTYLADKVSAPEAELLKQLRTAHDQMMRVASGHTGRWTLDAIAADWPQYRQATSQISRCWLEKVMWEQEVLFPLLQREIRAAA